jgi:hypothetical protein
LRGLALLDQLQEGLLNEVLGRSRPLPGVEHQRRAVGVDQARQLLRRHRSNHDKRGGSFREISKETLQKICQPSPAYRSNAWR